MILAVRLVNHPLFNKKQLQADYEAAPEGRQLEWTQAASRLCRMTGQVISAKDFVKVFALINTNSSFLADEDFHTYGLGLFYPNCYVNHSCWPNCVPIYLDSQQFYYAVQEIRPGDELTIAYCDIIEARSKRRRTLAQSFFFLCDCSRCHEPLTVDYYSECMSCTSCGGGISLIEDDALACNLCGLTTDYRRLESVKNRLNATAEKLAIVSTAGEASEFMRELENLGLHPLHRLWIEFCSKAIPLMVQQNLYKKAARLAQRFTEMSSMIFPPNYPTVAVEHYRAGRLLIFADDRPQAILHLKESLRMLSLYYSSENSEFVRHIADTVEGLEEEARLGRRLLHFN
jgi:hypothetical protein